jgi:putative phage-type endonuclease
MLNPDTEQGTDSWREIRRGKVTASKVADLTAKTKSGWGASRANYAAQLICERLTGVSVESYSNAAMQHGTATEPEARAAYSFMTDYEVVQTAFVNHPTITMSGASPDGLVNDDGLVELKCPNTSTHIDFLLGGGIPDKYIKQMQWQISCTGRAWCDYVSFDPRMPEKLKMKIQRVIRDDALIASLTKDIIEFLAEIDKKVIELERLAA